MSLSDNLYCVSERSPQCGQGYARLGVFRRAEALAHSEKGITPPPSIPHTICWDETIKLVLTIQVPPARQRASRKKKTWAPFPFNVLRN